MSAAVARVRAALRRLDDHWLGDAIGAVSLFGLLWMGLWAMEVLR